MKGKTESMKLKKTLVLTGIWFLVSSAAAFALPEETAPDPLLSVQRIFAGREFTPERFGPAHWMKDGMSYTLAEESASVKGAKDIVLYKADTGRKKVLVPASALIPEGQTAPLTIEDYAWSDDGKYLLIFTNSQRVWRQNTRGDYWVLDSGGRKLQKLGGGLDPASLQFAKFSPDGRTIAYVSKNNLYVEDPAAGTVRPLTRDGSTTLINGTGDWVYEEEFYLRDAFRWSPDGTKIAFWQIDSQRIKDFYLLNNTDSLYPRLTTIKYPKAGQTNSACRIGVVSAAGGDIVWLKVPGDPSDNYIPWMEWAAGSMEVAVQHLNRLQNTNEFMFGQALTGDTRTVFVDRDEAWVDVQDSLKWVDNGRWFTWLSERDGWRHAYLVSRDGKTIRLLTPGPYDVLSISALDEKGGWLYVMASPDNPAQAYLFRTRLDGRGRLERVSPIDKPGTHSYQISPTARWAFHTHSSFGTPPQTDLVTLPKHVVARTLVENKALRDKVQALKRSPAEFFRVDIGQGVLLDGWCLKPPDFDPAKTYPLFFYVYGEPASQTTLDRWGGNTYLWHQMLAQQGYIVASVDNRGTPAPRGREWRKCVYRRIGVLASADQAAAARALLKKWPYIDPERVGIWGWSGGGSMTLNAMFRHPDLYRTGIAVAFVSDQRLYDSIYQERYMGLPKDNEEGYTQGSPITFAKQLQGNLLLVHGTGDDNVHYQNCEALINELIRYDKKFTVMPYPNRSHGIYEGENTTRHLYELFTRFLNDNLPAGPRAKAVAETEAQK
jgi:dipeptidyl-peptidase-4